MATANARAVNEYQLNLLFSTEPSIHAVPPPVDPYMQAVNGRGFAYTLGAVVLGPGPNGPAIDNIAITLAPFAARPAVLRPEHEPALGNPAIVRVGGRRPR